jgi:hypothetical protein
MKTLRLFVLTINIFLAFFASAQYKIEVLDSNTFHLGEGVILSKISFRGLSVVDDKTIWVSGSRGTIAKSNDGGKTFSFQQLKDYKKSDFRDIEAFDDKRAIIMSSGTPAYILKTIDGGQTWKEVYKNTDTAYFLDAMDFWNDKKGMLVGDPINGHFLLLQTNDGGETWQQLDTSKTPKAFPGEAVFAASGTSLDCYKKDAVVFVSGGTHSRVFKRSNISSPWNFAYLDIIQGHSSQGSFSVNYFSGSFEIVGGDYQNPDFEQPFVIEYQNLNSYNLPSYKTGYLSCIEHIKHGLSIACGLKGVESIKRNSQKISTESFNVVRKAKKGKAVFLAGGKGKIGRLIY